jgi:hypothetical protein
MDQINFQQLESKEECLGKKEISFLLISALILGFLFDLLFYGKSLGLSYPLYILALYILLFWNMRNNQTPKFETKELVLGLPIIALSLTYLIYSNQIFAVLNFFIIPILLVAHTLLLTSNNRNKWFESLFIVEIIHGMVVRPLANCLKPFNLITMFMKPGANPGKFRVAGKVLTGILVAIVLLIVIVPLLASADDVFRQLVELILNLFKCISFNKFIPRLIMVTVVTCIVFSYLWSLFSSKTKLDEEVSNTVSLHKFRLFLDPITITTMLVLIDLLYALFIVIQFSYLFGSLRYGLPQDFTYAQYARKGFFELVVITLINLIILLGNLNFIKLSGSRLDKVVKILNTALVVSTFIILLSAHFRMSLYEAVYGFTYLRVLTHAFMAYLFILFAVTLCKIWYTTIHLLKSYLVISLISYTLINYINVDSIIVKNNIDRYNKGNPIDILYLTTLSYDVVPKLLELANSTSDQALASQLENGLSHKKKNLEEVKQWQSFNISMYRARKVLSQQ